MYTQYPPADYRKLSFFLQHYHGMDLNDLTEDAASGPALEVFTVQIMFMKIFTFRLGPFPTSK